MQQSTKESALQFQSLKNIINWCTKNQDLLNTTNNSPEPDIHINIYVYNKYKYQINR